MVIYYTQMTKQEEILGPHPVSHPVIGVWLDFEDREPTETQCLRFLSEKHEFDGNVVSRFSDSLIRYHYPDKAILMMKKNIEKLGFPRFAQYYEQSRKYNPQNEMLMDAKTKCVMTQNEKQKRNVKDCI